MSLHSRLSQILANRTLKYIDFHTEMNRGKASVRIHQLYVQRLWENILSNKNAIQTIEISYLLTRVTKMVVKTCLNISPRSWKINALWRAPLFFFPVVKFYFRQLPYRSYPRCVWLRLHLLGIFCGRQFPTVKYNHAYNY